LIRITISEYLYGMDELEEKIRKLREDFSKGTLSEQDIDRLPSIQFKKWMQQAAEARVPELQAMTLSTVGSQGRPSARVVYLREFGEDKYWFYTNYNSKKVQELTGNPHASLTFFWPQLERQVRIEGRVQKADAQHSDAYYDLRPFDSKVGAWASNQSGELKSRQELEQKVEELKRKFTPETISRPEYWGGMILKADYYEFWQGRKSRLHDRITFALENDNWKITRLAP
jgi:pyridoxamine 5'-phosphate oxidase